MEKKFLLTFVLLLLFAGVFNAQGVSKKWAIVQDLDDRIVYIDTTTIKEFEQKITIWSLVTYREPKEINPLQQKVYQIKSQFMINEITKKYSVIGTLYYDIKGKMIGETSIQTYSFGTDNSSIAIVEGSTIYVLLNKAKDYLTLGKFSEEKSEFLKNFDKNVTPKIPDLNSGRGVKKDSLANNKPKDIDSLFNAKLKETTKAPQLLDSAVIKKNDKPAVKKPEVKKDSIKADTEGVNKIVNQKIDSTKIKERNQKKIPIDSTALNKLKKDISDETAQLPIKPVIDPENVRSQVEEKTIDQKPADKKLAVKKPAEKKKEEPVKSVSGNYNSSRETNSGGVIFTDGSLFCFQVSSWKLKSQADKEVARLASKGHNAFIQEADVPGKGKWFRVRVGYFNSLAETQAYKKKVK